MHKQSWSIVVLCYNEVNSISIFIDRVKDVFDTHRRGRYEIIVVDDGSIDGSYEKIQEAVNARPDVVRIVRHMQNAGIGNSILDGYRAAKNENVVAIACDGQFDVRELIPYLDLEEDTFVSFYRLENVQYSSFRAALSWVNKYINKYLVGMNLMDVNWVKIYKRKAILSFPWALSSSLVESEICAKLLIDGYRAVEVLSYSHVRHAGKSKGASWKVIMQAGFDISKLIFVVRKFRKEVVHQPLS